MPAIPTVVRRGAAYYWRRRLPAGLAESKRSATLVMALRTRDPRRARFLATQLNAVADRYLFPAFMTEPRLTHQQMQTIFRQVFARHLDKLEAVVAREKQESDFNPEESERSGRVMGWVFRLLESRGPKIAALDATAVAAMRADNLSEAEISEVGAMLGLVTRRGDLADPAARVEAIVRDAGGEPTPINIALARQTIYGAIAEANFESARRHDGRREETAALVTSVLGERIEETHVGAEPPNFGNRRAADSPHAAVVRPQTNGQTIGASGAPPRLDDHPIIVLGEKLIAKNSKGAWDVKTQRQARQIYRLLARLLHENQVFDIASIRQSHFAALEGLLCSVATSYGKSPHDSDRSIAELRAIGAAKPAAERGVQPGTLNRHLTFLGQLLAFIRGQGESLDAGIDLSLLRGKNRGRGRHKRATLDSGELTRIFQLACFVGCAGWDGGEAFTPGPLLFHRALYFAIVLLYYSGCRREEICGLAVEDIRDFEIKTRRGQTEAWPCLMIRPNSHRRLKNSQSVRVIPLHPEAIRLGFIP